MRLVRAERRLALSANRTERIVGGVGLALVVLATAVYLDSLGHGRIFFFDEWDFVLDRREGGIDALLQPHNGHLSLVPAGLYRALFEVVGLAPYWTFRWMGTTVHVLVGVVVFLLLRKRNPPVRALALTSPLVLLGAGWENLLWPFQVGTMASVLFGLVALLLLDRRTGGADLGAAAALAVAVASTGFGLPFAVGAAIEAALDGGWRRVGRVVGPAGALYALWYLGYGTSKSAVGDTASIGSFLTDGPAAAVAALAGLSIGWGRFFAVVVLAGLVAAVVGRRQADVRLVSLAATTVALWLLLALGRGSVGDPAASRYVYVGAVLVVLLVGEVVADARHPTAVTVAVAVLAPLCILAGLSTLRSGAAQLRRNSTFLRAELAEVERLGADRVDPDFRPDPVRAPQIAAGPYLAAVEALGSPLADDPDATDPGPAVLHEVDRVARQAQKVLVPARGRSFADCSPRTVSTPTEVSVSASEVLGVTASGRTEVRLRRAAAAQPAAPVATLDEDRAIVVQPADDGAPWVVEIRPDRGTSATLHRCRG
jgi:hypothetical protein